MLPKWLRGTAELWAERPEEPEEEEVGEGDRLRIPRDAEAELALAGLATRGGSGGALFDDKADAAAS